MSKSYFPLFSIKNLFSPCIKLRQIASEHFLISQDNYHKIYVTKNLFHNVCEYFLAPLVHLGKPVQFTTSSPGSLWIHR